MCLLLVHEIGFFLYILSASWLHNHRTKHDFYRLLHVDISIFSSIEVRYCNAEYDGRDRNHKPLKIPIGPIRQT